MGARKLKKKGQCRPKEIQFPPLTLHTIISAIQSPEGLIPANMRILYAMLVHLSQNKPAMSWSNCESAASRTDENLDECGLQLKFKEYHYLSDILFEELDRRFKELFSALRDVSATRDSGQAALLTDIWAKREELMLLLRCCMVFADELLVHKSLREYFTLIDFASSRSEMLFNFHFGHGNLGCVLEVICAHFILSVSNELVFVRFINRLFWCHNDDFRIPEISLPASLSLLLNPVMLSAPKMFQAHLILLVSEVIGICAASENIMLDVRLMDWYSTAFERSVVLYTRHMSNLYVDSNNLDGNGSFDKLCSLGGSQPTFESFLLQATMDKIHHLIAKSKNFASSYLSDMSSGTNSDLVAVSMAYVKENLCIFDESYKDEILSILNCIILGCSSNDINGPLFQKIGEISPQDLYLLASILKLMSSSMLQAIWCLRRARNSECLKSHRDVSSCKEYDYIVGVLGCFQQFSIRLPIQNFLYESMQSHPARHKESKWMLLHLSGLLSLTYVSGIDFLVKSCLFMMMTLLNWFLVEECDLSALGSLFGFGSNSCSPKLSDNVEGVLVIRKTSRIISSKFQKIHDMYLRTGSFICSNKIKQDEQAETLKYSSVPNDLDSAVADNTKETSNGEMFLKCVLGQNSRVSDFDDLADFIECKPEKDYSSWLRDRQRFRQWKYKKMISLRWKKKKMTWNSMKVRQTRSWVVSGDKR
ncbi:hypothetical protein GH714_033536 [Hevea brasiliensis]|uniref:DUF7812 domain-containing protein n=1 Tax=Hevea brasiliensis TaxID=3981 RepID=A0A6A6MM45_HEVBR|nr:hypothetical protein GH714_033536 [Hevea brasiliensis]